MISNRISVHLVFHFVFQHAFELNPQMYLVVTVYLFLQAEEEVNTAKSIFEGINNELREELPALFDR